MFRKRDSDPNTNPMVKEDVEETLDLRPKKDEETLDLQPEDDEETLDLQPEDDEETLDLRPENDGEALDLRPEDDEETLDLRPEKNEESLDLQPENGEETLDLRPENDEETLDLRRENDENHHDLQPENIVKADPVPSEPAVKPIDPPESKSLTPSPKMTPAADPSPADRTDPQANKRLIVGQGIRLSGEINSCDRLVVEGEVEVTLNDTLALEITSSGRFTGGCEVEEADISGIYEGDLTVRNTLFVRGTGRITGTIRYGQLELERGGQIAGNISVLGNEMPTTNSDAAKARLAKAPLFGDGKPS